MSKIPLKPSALYRQQKKNPPPGLESLVISDSSSHQKSKKIRAMDNENDKPAQSESHASQDMDVSGDGSTCFCESYHTSRLSNLD